MSSDCICVTLPDLAHVPMGLDGLDEKLFTTVERVKVFGESKYWLYLGKCSACEQDWLVAQEERIFDEYFLRKLTRDRARKIVSGNVWPEEFFTYEDVLQTGAKLSNHCRFVEYVAPSLVWTAEDLRAERPSITTDEIAELIGVDSDRASAIVEAIPE